MRRTSLDEKFLMCFEYLSTEELLEEMRPKLTENTYLIYKRALQSVESDIHVDNFYHYMRFLRDRIIYHAHKKC